MAYLNNGTFYLAYKDAKPSWALISCAFIFGIIATLGIIFNVAVIFVTIRTKQFRGTVNYLLALCSFFELLHQQGHFLFVYTAFSGQNFIEYRLAAKIELISMLAICGIYPTMLFTGIDRLIGIIFNEMYRKTKIRLYLATITTVWVAFCFDLCKSLYQNIELIGDQMVTGCLIDIIKGPDYQRMVWLLLNLMTIAIYLFVGIMIRIKSAGLPSSDQINRRTFRSLFCVITVNAGGYCIYLTYCVLIKPSISSPITAWFGQFITAIPLKIGAASNGPILYFTSTDYHQAFRSVFPFVFKRFSASNRTAPQQNFYLAYKDAKPSWALISCAFIFGIIATLGIIFNVAVIFVTIRTKQFRGTVNYLLALCSFFELLHQQGHFLFVYTAFSGQNFIEYRLAAKIELISMLAICGIYPTMLFTGIDRLIGIIFNEMYRKTKIRLYLATITTVWVAFCFDLCKSLYQNIELIGDQMVTGCLIDIIKGPDYQRMVWLLLNLMTIAIYLFVGIMIRIKSAGLPSSDQINRRTLRSLFCVIAVNAGGYCIYLTYCVLIKPSISSPITAWFGQFITAIPLNIGAASNGPILYFTSTDYHQAFRSVFPFVFKRFSAQNRTAPQQNVQPVQLITNLIN
ncbi:hypothetical protein niasHT_012842 [Heterodera trifolii]|uniref:G_PROTEIN_RECEP_F1_2 domain-containing protein n=1 Tax=Heterodera trifolii TaxID=157864 RepID=A0ABD2L0A0_9BILA